MMLKNEWFRARVCETWQALHAENDGFLQIPSVIRRLSAVYVEEFKEDAVRWTREHNQAEQAEKTAKWFISRITWMNSEFGAR
jgi:hypothetical protein